MINETVILLSPLEDCSQHKLSKHIGRHLGFVTAFDYYFYKPLQEIFSRVVPYDFETRLMEIGVSGINQEIIALVRKEQPKYAIWVSWGDYYEIQESTFARIRQEGTIAIGCFLCDETEFDGYSKFWTPYLDYCVTDDIEAVPKYQALGARPILAPMGAVTGTAFERDWSNIEEKYEVSFVGAKKVDREQYLSELKKRNIPIHVSGAGWGGFIPYDEMIDIYKTSKINLNLSKVGGNKPLVKGRIFEVCLAGGFMLTEYAPGIENYFEIDKEIVCFDDANEMIDKINYYLSHETERRAIAQAGWKRASSEYSSFQILSRVFGEIEKDFAARGTRGHLQEIEKPRRVRQRISNFYLKWAIAFSMENYKGLWKDALALSLGHYPFNTLAWCHYIISFLPFPVRLAIVRLYRAFYYRVNKQGKESI